MSDNIKELIFKEWKTGFVISNYDLFKYEDFSKNVGKYVRANHFSNKET